MKTKKLTKIAGVVTLLACIWGGVSCEQNLPEETYTVTFDSDGGSEIEPVTVKDGEKVTKPEADPTKDGYTFKGWFNGDTEYDFETAVTANITLKAKWEVVVVNYKVTFDSDGGSEVAAVEVKDGEKVTKPAADPTKTGYTFKGWFIGDKDYDFEKAVTANITLKAKWEVVTYTVKFDSDGGSVVESAKVNHGEKVKKPADPTKTGYTFKGWLNGETVYDFEKAVTADITLKAKWEVVTYNITYELNGGTGDEGNPETYTIETDTFEIKNLVSGPDGKPYFVGWYSDKDFTKPAEITIKKGTTGNLSFYAKWTDKATFTVTFKFVGVEESASVNVEEGEALTSAQLESVKSKISSDYEFVGFYTNQECTTEFDVKQTFTSNFTLYVKVNEIKKFTVTFESAGGSPVAAAVVKDGAKVTKPADPTKTGYTFKGWFDGDDKEYDFEKAVTADITLNAKWEVMTYTVTFNSDNGSPVAAAKVNHGAKVPKPADPTKTGYTFKGWFIGDKEYDFETSVTDNITLKAKWEENKATEPETPKITYLVEKATTEFTVSNQWSQANISGMDKEYKKGDWIVTGGTVSIDGTKKIGQAYLQFGNDGGSKKIAEYYEANSTKTSTSYTFYCIYRVDEDFKATYAQVACQEESNGSIVSLAKDSKFTVSDFYVVHLPKADMAKLTTEIKVADTIEMPYKDHGADGKGYQLDLEAVNFTTTEGKIVCLYNRPAVKNDWKNHFINGGYVAKGEDGYTAVYPGANAGLISITRDVKAGNTCGWFQIGIVGQDTTESDTLAITDLEVRIIPNF